MIQIQNMQTVELDNTEDLIHASTAADVSLGYNLIVTDECFCEVKRLYGNDTQNLPEKFDTFANVCEFIEKVSLNNKFMMESWPLLADSLYKPAALAVLAKMRLYNQSKNN